MMAPAMAGRRRGRRKERRRKGVSERRKEGRGERGGEESERATSVAGREEEGSRCWTTIALFITPEVAEFTIKIPRSAALMDRRARNARRRLWYFQMNPPLFPPRDASARCRELEEWGRKPAILPLDPSRPSPDDIDEFCGATCRREGICLGDSISICRRFFGRSFDRSIAERREIGRIASVGACVVPLCIKSGWT